MGTTQKSLEGGSLAAVMSEHMLADAAERKMFTAALKKPDAKVCGAWEKMFGWTPANEHAEWKGVAGAYRKLFESISDVWMLGGDIDWKPTTIDKLVNSTEGIFVLLTGLVHFGDDPSGDRSYLSTLPAKSNLAEVHVFNHENGKLDGGLSLSIASFVYENWCDDKDDAVVDKFEKAAKATRDKDLAAEALFTRMEWLWALPTGKTGFHLAEAMDTAPAFSVWEKEQKQIAKTPVLANYWMLAHLFLGNDVACAEACALAKKAPGTLTPALAKLVAAVLAKPKSVKLGKLAPAKLAELRDAVAKNADAKLLEPARRKAVTEKRSANTGDIATHEKAMVELAKADKKLAKAFTRFEEERGKGGEYSRWPDRWDIKKDEWDDRLSPLIGATFRAGLTFDADHKKSAASLVHALVHLDDDEAMTAFADAIERCKGDDDRLKPIVAALRASKHSRAHEVLARGAWRFFEQFDATVKATKATRKEGPTLNNMFRVHSHLLGAVIARIRVGDDESEKLVDKVCSIRSNMTVLGAAYAVAFQQVGNKKLARHKEFLGSYFTHVTQMTGTSLNADTLYNLAEAAIGYTKLDPDGARKHIGIKSDAGALGKLDEGRDLWFDQMSGFVGAVLLHSPEPNILRWAERFLGSRTNSARVYPVLRAIADGKIVAAKEWVRPHLYAGVSSNHIGEKPAVLRAAREALVALGEPEPPEFDTSDEFANKRKPDELAGALLQHERHQLDSVFERIVEAKVRSAEVVRVAGDVLRDLYRFSADDADRSSADGRKEGLACMLFQGAPALPELATLLDLPLIAASDKTVVLLIMAAIANSSAALARFAALDEAALLAEVVPGPATYATLHLAAAVAFARCGDRAHAAVEAAFRWRAGLVEPRMDHWITTEPQAVMLTRLAGQLPKGKKLLADTAQPDNYGWEQVLAGETDEPTYEVTLSGNKLVWSVEDAYCNGIIPDRKYSHASSVDTAQTSAIQSALGLLGLASAKKKKK